MADSVTDLLRSEILSARLAPGDRLVELQLAERFGQGRATIRTALVELEKEGLVIREANRGATVRRVSLSEAIQITEARAALEGLVAARAACQATDADRAELAGIIERMTKAVADDELVEYSELNALLHRRIREISDHSVANELVRNLRDRGASHQFRLALMPGRATESLEQHRAIVEAVVAGDGPAAAQAMNNHLSSVIAVLNRWAGIEGVR